MAKRKRLETEEVVGVGVDITKNTLEIVVSNINETRQFENDYEGIISIVRDISALKPARIILVAAAITRYL